MTVTMPPFHTPGAFANSSYGRWTGEQLVLPNGEPASPMARDVHAALRAQLHDPDFPCVGAKSVVNQNSYRFGLYPELATPDSTEGLALDLFRFGRDLEAVGGEFHSYIACFLEPKLREGKTFEALLWQQLKALHDLNRQHFDWNQEVSRDPAHAGFSFSFAGGAYFVVGLSPASPRWARHFPWPTLIFNDHFQFERLREGNHFDRIRDVIRLRDEALHGTPNTALEDYGAHSEAQQYSGLPQEDGWRCPVKFD
jgi:FPC/CPF motif-containing protein YcgG